MYCFPVLTSVNTFPINILGQSWRKPRGQGREGLDESGGGTGLPGRGIGRTGLVYRKGEVSKVTDSRVGSTSGPESYGRVVSEPVDGGPLLPKGGWGSRDPGRPPP